MDGLTTIHLGGKLGTLHGKTWHLRVSSPAEAIRAININTGGKLRQYLATEGAKKFYKIAVGKKTNVLEKNELRNRSGEADIYVLPTVHGANSGAGKIIAGIVLIVAAVITQQYELLGPVGQGTFGGAVVSAGYGLGASLVLGGVTQLLTPTPNFNNSSSAGQGSTLFNGNAVAVNQGGAVPLIYGRALVPAVPICISFSNEDVQVTADSNSAGSTSSVGGSAGTAYTVVNLPGGGYQFVPPIGPPDIIHNQP